VPRVEYGPVLELRGSMSTIVTVNAPKSTPLVSGARLPAGDFSRTRGGFAGAHVLVIDDEALIRWAIAETLTDRGSTVTVAGTCAEALRVATDARPPFDVVLLDVRLPDSTDLALLARLRTETPASAIIVMTAYETPEMLQQANALGAHRVVPKPFKIGELASIVAQALRARAC
jgi:two-component system response regulator PilR (NtrC family)